MLHDAYYRIIRRPFSFLLLSVILFLLCLLIVSVQASVESRQKMLVDIAENTEIRCVMKNRVSGQTDNLGIAYTYVQGSYYEKRPLIYPYMDDPIIETTVPKAILGDTEGTVIAVNTLLAYPAAQLSSADTDTTFLEGTDMKCLVSRDLEEKVTDESIMVRFNGGSTQTFFVAGYIDNPQTTVIIPWQTYRDKEGTGFGYGIWLDSFSFRITDNKQLEEIKEALRTFFTLEGEASLSAQEVLSIRDLEYRRNELAAIRNLAMMQFVEPLILAGAILVGCLFTLWITRKRRQEYALLSCLGVTNGKVVLCTVLEFLLACVVGCGAAYLCTGIPLKSILLISCAFLGSAVCVMIWQMTKPLMKRSKEL